MIDLPTSATLHALARASTRAGKRFLHDLGLPSSASALRAALAHTEQAHGREAIEANTRVHSMRLNDGPSGVVGHSENPSDPRRRAREFARPARMVAERAITPHRFLHLFTQGSQCRMGLARERQSPTPGCRFCSPTSPGIPPDVPFWGNRGNKRRSQEPVHHRRVVLAHTGGDAGTVEGARAEYVRRLVEAKTALEIRGRRVRVHRAAVWRIVRSMAALGAPNTPDGRAAAIGHAYMRSREQ